MSKSSILGSEYNTTLKSILSNIQPSLILLHYNLDRWSVEDLTLVHRACITSSCVIPRTPLRETAKRAGWQGCLISLKEIPKLGRIGVISQGLVREKQSVLDQWKQTSKLLQADPVSRGWLADILNCVERLYSTFTLENVYSFENELSQKHPNNHNIRAKIRQQLQLLRDMGIIEFIKPGVYRYVKAASGG